MAFTVTCPHSLGVKRAVEKLQALDSGLDLRDVRMKLVGKVKGGSGLIGKLIEIEVSIDLSVQADKVLAEATVIDKPLLVSEGMIETAMQSQLCKALED